MIGRLVGKVVAEDIDGTITLDVQGVGYDVKVPVGALARAKSGTTASDVTLIVHTHVREDALDLYGFASDVERKVFRLLLGVPNVGPKLAMGVLSALPPRELAVALEQRDIKRLNKVNGVGKKTAERLVLELREKLPQVADLEQGGQPALVPKDDRARLTGALLNMGYKQAEADRAVEGVRERLGQDSLSELLRAALRELNP